MGHPNPQDLRPWWKIRSFSLSRHWALWAVVRRRQQPRHSAVTAGNKHCAWEWTEHSCSALCVLLLLLLRLRHGLTFLWRHDAKGKTSTNSLQGKLLNCSLCCDYRCYILCPGWIWNWILWWLTYNCFNCLLMFIVIIKYRYTIASPRYCAVCEILMSNSLLQSL